MTEEVKEEEATEEVAGPDVVLGFSVIKSTDGAVAVRPIEGTETNQDDIYNLCHSICKNIDAQGVANMVAMQMVQAAAHAQEQASGLVVPKGGVPSNLRRVK